MELSQVLTIVGWVLGPVCSALIVGIVNMRRKFKDEKRRADKAEQKAAQEASDIERARIIIDKASARQHILNAYKRFVIDGEHMTIARYEELLEEYEAYTLLGGNGTAKAYMKEIQEKRPYLVTE